MRQYGPPPSCCEDVHCERNQPILLMRGGSGDFYVVTQYIEQGPGKYFPRSRHRLPQSTQHQLTTAMDDSAWLQKVMQASKLSKSEILEKLGLDLDDLFS